MNNLSTIDLRNEPKKEPVVQESASSTTLAMIKSEFKVWVDPTTIHGLPNIFRTNNIIAKIIWIISTMAATVLCAYILTQSILDYMAFQVVTKIDLVEETSAVVPQITICSAHLYVTNSSLGNFFFISTSPFIGKIKTSTFSFYQYNTFFKFSFFST
jgi:hypothetical protein